MKKIEKILKIYFKQVPMRYFSLFFIVSLLSIHVQAYNNSVVYDEAYEGKWIKEFIQLSVKSKDMEDFMIHLGNVDRMDFHRLKQHFNLHQKVPVISYANGVISFDKQMQFKVLNLPAQEFLVNNHKIKYDFKKSIFENMQMIQKELDRKKSVKIFWPLGFVENLFAAKTKSKNDDETGSDDSEVKELVFYNEYEKFTSDPTKLSDNSVFGWAIISPLMLGDYLLSKLYTLNAPSCKNQMAQLDAVLKENNRALKTISCGSDYRGNDRKVSFWLPYGDAKKFAERAFDLDFRAGTLQEPGKDRLMLFNYSSLKEIRDLNYDKEGHLYRTDYREKSAIFDEAKKDIEPYRKVLYYMGINQTCEKCPVELAHLVSLKNPPSYLFKKELVSKPEIPDEGDQ